MLNSLFSLTTFMAAHCCTTTNGAAPPITLIGPLCDIKLFPTPTSTIYTERKIYLNLFRTKKNSISFTD